MAAVVIDFPCRCYAGQMVTLTTLVLDSYGGRALASSNVTYTAYLTAPSELPIKFVPDAGSTNMTTSFDATVATLGFVVPLANATMHTSLCRSLNATGGVSPGNATQLIVGRAVITSAAVQSSSSQDGLQSLRFVLPGLLPGVLYQCDVAVVVRGFEPLTQRVLLVTSPAPKLASGAIVGIAIAGLVFIVAASVVGLFLWRRQQRRKVTAEPTKVIIKSPKTMPVDHDHDNDGDDDAPGRPRRGSDGGFDAADVSQPIVLPAGRGSPTSLPVTAAESEHAGLIDGLGSGTGDLSARRHGLLSPLHPRLNSGHGSPFTDPGQASVVDLSPPPQMPARARVFMQSNDGGAHAGSGDDVVTLPPNSTADAVLDRRGSMRPAAQADVAPGSPNETNLPGEPLPTPEASAGAQGDSRPSSHASFRRGGGGGSPAAGASPLQLLTTLAVVVLLVLPTGVVACGCGAESCGFSCCNCSPGQWAGCSFLDPGCAGCNAGYVCAQGACSTATCDGPCPAGANQSSSRVLDRHLCPDWACFCDDRLLSGSHLTTHCLPVLLP